MQVDVSISEMLKTETEARRAQEREKAVKLAEQINSKAKDVIEIDGYKITAEQCNRINAGDKEAIDKFFQDNVIRLHRLAKVFLRRAGIPLRWDKLRNCYEPAIVEIYDCVNQLYIDLRQRRLILSIVPQLLSSAICHSFRYAGVGGFGDEDGFYVHKKLYTAGGK